jgi:hypothetical protein
MISASKIAAQANGFFLAGAFFVEGFDDVLLPTGNNIAVINSFIALAPY